MDQVFQAKKPIENRKVREVTFIVTKDCQLACKYCYEVSKNQKERMDLDTAKRAIDYILEHYGDREMANDDEYALFDFIGGEPLLEIDLIERICDYIEERLAALDHPWRDCHRYSMTSNGINYANDKVQRFIHKYHDRLHFTLTIDGTKRKHDINRVWRNNPSRGSYDDVVRNVPLWLRQFPGAATKVTVSHPDLPYICESVLHLFSLGITVVNINCVFEDAWHEGDDIILEQQLRQLADAIIDKGLWRDHACSFFNDGIGHPLDNKRDNVNWCGAGRMLAVDAAGIFYPCIRLAKYSLRSKEPRVIGNVTEGIDPNRVRPFLNLERMTQSSKECIECEVASGCAWCQGENYDCSVTGTIFHRSTAICLMHKARVRANNYFWERLAQVSDARPRKWPTDNDTRCLLQKDPSPLRGLTVLLDDSSAATCHNYPQSRPERLIALDDLIKVGDMAKADPQLSITVTYPDRELPERYVEVLSTIPHRKVARAGVMPEADMDVIEGTEALQRMEPEHKFYSLIAPLSEMIDNIDKIKAVLSVARRLNIHPAESDIELMARAEDYRTLLSAVERAIEDEWRRKHYVRCNIITDDITLQGINQCGAGDDNFTLAPNGRFYPCPAFYFADAEHDCGDFETGIKLPHRELYQRDHSKVCRNCRVKHCKRCVYDNLATTCEVNTPSYQHCQRVEIEVEYANRLYKKAKRPDKKTATPS